MRWLPALVQRQSIPIAQIGKAVLHAFRATPDHPAIASMQANKIGRSGIFIERACLKFLDPDADQVARDVVALRESVERLARNKFLGDLPYR